MKKYIQFYFEVPGCLNRTLGFTKLNLTDDDDISGAIWDIILDECESIFDSVPLEDYVDYISFEWTEISRTDFLKNLERTF